MRIRVPIFVKIMTPLIVVIFLSLVLSGYFIFNQNTRERREEVATRLRKTAETLARGIDTEKLQSIQTPTDYKTAAYKALEEQLNQSLATGGLDWIGIYRREGDHLYYSVDTDSTGIGYPFLYYSIDQLRAFDDPGGSAHEVQYADEFGAWYGFDAPIVVTGEDGQPQVIGLVEALVSQEKLELFQRATVMRLRYILIGGTLGAVLLALMATIVTFNRPLRRLKRGAMILAGGQIGYTIDLNSNDEMSDLADTFNDMSTQLKLHYDEIQQRNTELQMVYQIAQAITASSSDPDETFRTILERVNQMIPYEEGEICVYVPAEKALRVRGWKGLEDSIDWRDRKYPLGVGLTGWVAENRRSFRSGDIMLEPVYDKIVDNPVRSYVGVPLLVGERLMGTMALTGARPDQFDEHARKLLETIALQAAVAIDTAQKVEARERQLEAQIAQLRIEVDEAKRAKEVADVTETDFFRTLQEKAQGLREQRAGKE